MKKYLMEFIGTFFLVLTICMSVNTGMGNFAPLAIGAILIGVIYAGGHISLAHYNPAVTLSFYLVGKCKAKEIPGYLIGQLGGAILAVLSSNILLDSYEPAITVKMSNLYGKINAALFAEFLGTFLLCFVILNVAKAKNLKGNNFYGTAIAFTVIGLAYSLGGVSGGAFNPAVAVGLSFANMFSWENIWVFLLASSAAGAVAAFVFKYITEMVED